MTVFAILSCLSLLVWLYLLFGRGRFWQVELPAAAPAPARWPGIVAIVPARNEAACIGRSLGSLLNQHYAGELTVIVVDDHSDDGTAAIAEAVAADGRSAHRLIVISAPPLPADWVGKVWAQQQGLAAADAMSPGADFIFLTDADVDHPPGELAALVARAIAGPLDLASEMVRLRAVSPAERWLVPAFAFFFAQLYPPRWIADPRRATAAAAGPCMLVRRTALDRIGQLNAISSAIIDDCALAAALKPHGPIRLDPSPAARSLRTYDDWHPIWQMVARSAFTELHGSYAALAGVTVLMLMNYLAPPLLTIVGAWLGAWWGWPAALAWLAMAVSYRPTLRYYRQPGWHAPLMPLVALFFLGAMLDSARLRRLGRGGEWKGRVNNVAGWNDISESVELW
jgi:hopene-associated glycosyltransferase HpnB